MKIHRWRLATAAAIALYAFAQGTTAEMIVVRAGKLLDVEQGRYLVDQAIRIDDGRIASISPWSAGSRGGGRLVDWSAYTVIPGLIDLHTHLVGDISSADVAAPLSSSAARDALLGVAHARATLAAGFTTVRDVGTYRALVDIALRNAINAGLVEGPRMFAAGAYVTITNGAGEVTGMPEGVKVPDEMRRGVADDEAAVRRRVRELLAGGAEGIKNAVRAGVRTIEHGSYLDDEGIQLMLKHGTWLVADVYNGDYTEEVGTRDGWSEEILRKNRETTDIQRKNFEKAVRAGVRIGFGTDAGIYPHGDNARQFQYMVRHGMTPLGAIRAATIDAAASLGRSQEFGSITPGKFGDLVAIAGDPLEDIERMRHVAGVIKQGALIRTGDSR